MATAAACTSPVAARPHRATTAWCAHGAWQRQRWWLPQRRHVRLCGPRAPGARGPFDPPRPAARGTPPATPPRPPRSTRTTAPGGPPAPTAVCLHPTVQLRTRKIAGRGAAPRARRWRWLRPTAARHRTPGGRSRWCPLELTRQLAPTSCPQRPPPHCPPTAAHAQSPPRQIHDLPWKRRHSPRRPSHRPVWVLPCPGHRHPWPVCRPAVPSQHPWNVPAPPAMPTFCVLPRRHSRRPTPCSRRENAWQVDCRGLLRAPSPVRRQGRGVAAWRRLGKRRLPCPPPTSHGRSHGSWPTRCCPQTSQRPGWHAGGPPWTGVSLSAPRCPVLTQRQRASWPQTPSQAHARPGSPLQPRLASCGRQCLRPAPLRTRWGCQRGCLAGTPPHGAAARRQWPTQKRPCPPPALAVRRQQRRPASCATWHGVNTGPLARPCCPLHRWRPCPTTRCDLPPFPLHGRQPPALQRPSGPPARAGCERR